MTFRRLLTITLGLFLSAACLFAEKTAEELRKELPELKGSKRLKALEELFYLSQESSPLNQQIRCVDDLIDEAHRQGNHKEEGSARVQRVVLFYNNDLNDSIYKTVPTEMEFMKKHELWYYYYEIWMHLVNTYTFSDSCNTARRMAEAMFEDSKQRKDEFGIGAANYCLALVYYYLGDMEGCVKSCETSLNIFSRADEVPSFVTDIYAYYGDALNAKKDYARLKKLTTRWAPFIKSFLKKNKLEENGPEADVLWSYYYIACTQAALGLDSLEEASRMLDKVEALAVTQGENVEKEWIFYAAQLRFQQKNYKEALELNTHRMEMMIEDDDKSEPVKVRLQRADILKAMGRYQEAAELYSEVYALNDSLNAAVTKSQLNEMNSLFQLDDLKMGQARLKMEKERQQYLWGIGLAVLVVIALVILSLFRYRAAKRLKAAHDQLEQAHDKLLTAYDNLEETTKAKERIESDLRIARDIQMGMVPQKFPPFPERTDIDLFASMTPAKEVGGDLYDFTLLNEKLYFCLGDVSGKGVPASLFMAVARNLFRVVAQQELPPAEIATKLNNALAEDNENGMFVTMFIGVVNLTTGHLDFCNAGHNPPVIKDLQGNASFLEMEPNAPLGLWPGLDYEGESLDNICNKPFFVYSDGLNEAMNPDEVEFGDDHLLQILNDNPYENAQQTIELMKAEVVKHVNGAEQSDDLTMLCVKITGKTNQTITNSEE